MNKFALSVAAAACLLSGSAFAQAHLGASLGLTNSNIDCDGTASCDRTSLGFKVYGGYMFSRHIAGEVSYFDLGKTQATVQSGGAHYKATIKGSGMGLGLALYAPFTPKWKGVARFGIATNETSIRVAGGGAANATSETHTTGYGGLGVSYAVDRNTSVDATMDFTRVKFASQSSDVRATSVGMSYAF